MAVSAVVTTPRRIPHRARRSVSRRRIKDAVILASIISPLSSLNLRQACVHKIDLAPSASVLAAKAISHSDL